MANQTVSCCRILCFKDIKPYYPISCSNFMSKNSSNNYGRHKEEIESHPQYKRTVIVIATIETLYAIFMLSTMFIGGLLVSSIKSISLLIRLLIVIFTTIFITLIYICIFMFKIRYLRTVRTKLKDHMEQELEARNAAAARFLENVSDNEQSNSDLSYSYDY